MIIHLNGVDYEVDFEITSYGSPPHMGSLTYAGDPGYPPEILIKSVEYQLDPGQAGWTELPDLGTLWEKLEEKILEDPRNFEYQEDFE